MNLFKPATIIGIIGFGASLIGFLVNLVNPHSFGWWMSIMGMVGFGLFALICGLYWMAVVINERHRGGRF